MKITQESLRCLIMASLGMASIAGCQTGASQNAIQRESEPIATDVALQSELTSPPTPDFNDSAKSYREASRDRNGVELVDFQSSNLLESATVSNANAPIPIPEVPQEAMTLKEIQDLALTNNPTIRALSASAQAEQDYQYQVGRSANPEVGYAANQLADQGTDQHLVYVQREFVTGDKLALNQNVLGHSVEAQRWDVESQRYRVLTDVRMKFIQALVAQRQMDMIDEFHAVVFRGVGLARRRFNAKEAARADVLQAEIQLNEVEILRQKSEYRWKAAWKEMAAVAGIENLPPSKLDGDLSVVKDSPNWEDVYATLAMESPEIQSANSRIRQARSHMSRQEIQAIPNITANLQAGVDNSTGSGLIQLQVGAPIPVFNDNRGNVSAAYNEYSRATHELKRVEMSLKARLAQVSQEYDSANFAVQRFEQQILPKAQETLDLAEKAYEAGEFSFLQTLIARRTYFDTNLNYLDSLGGLAQSQAKVDGLLLTGALGQSSTSSLGDGLRGQTFSQQ